MSNERVSPRGILAPHFDATARRAGRGDVIVAHDTTNFVFRGITKREGLGRFKNGVAQGFFGPFAHAAHRLCHGTGREARVRVARVVRAEAAHRDVQRAGPDDSMSELVRERRSCAPIDRSIRRITHALAMSATAAETRIAELEAVLAAAGAALAQGQAAVLAFSFSRETQLWVTTHARALADALAARGAKVVVA